MTTPPVSTEHDPEAPAPQSALQRLQSDSYSREKFFKRQGARGNYQAAWHTRGEAQDDLPARECGFGCQAAGQGFEPQLPDPESGVLPLDYPASSDGHRIGWRRPVQ